MPEVKCTVSSCSYWANGNRCEADQILITAGPATGKDPLGRNAHRLSTTPVALAEQSYCWTFVPREPDDVDDSDEMDPAEDPEIAGMVNIAPA